MVNEIKKIAGKTIINEKLLGTGENAIKLQPSSEASGNNSVAEGTNTQALGDSSHAEGIGTTASGKYSHAEGYLTEASKLSSHAEGSGTSASGNYSHAEGYNTIAMGNNSHSEGATTIAGQKGFSIDPLNRIDKKYKLYSVDGLSINDRVSIVNGDPTNPQDFEQYLDFGKITEIDADNMTITVDIYQDFGIEAYLFVMGKNIGDTTVYGISHAEGKNTQAFGYVSHAEGNGTTASGNSSHAEGYNTQASGYSSHAEGNSTMTIGENSHAEGYNTKIGQKGFLIDKKNSSRTGKKYKLYSIDGLEVNDVVSIKAGTAINNLTESYLDFGTITKIDTENKTITVDTYQSFSGSVGYLFVVGKNNYGEIISGSCSHVEGNNSKVIGNSSHAEGDATVTYGDASHAEGKETTASGDYSHAEGNNTQTLGESAHAEGAYTTASKYCSHAEGEGSTASGDSSHAEGWETIASGYVSHAEGWNTTASGDYSHAEGYYTTASGESSHVEGKYNISDTNNRYVHIVGNGQMNYETEIEEYSNAHTLDWDGNAWYQGKVKIGGTSYDDGKELAIFDEVCGNKSVESETASIMVTDHLKEKNIINYQIYGNSVQETRSGKNILPYSYVETTKTENDITFTDNGNGTITVNGTASADTTFNLCTDLVLTAGTYTFSGCPSDGSDTTYFISGFTGTDIGSGFTVVLDSDTTGSLSITIKSGTTISNKVFKPQIEVGSVKTSYEQYGTMPSPDFSSEIQSVGDLVTDTSSEYYGKYDVPVYVTGKNLLSIKDIYSTPYTGYGLTISQVDDYTIEINGEFTGSAKMNLGKTPLIVPIKVDTTKKYSITCKYISGTTSNPNNVYNFVYFTQANDVSGDSEINWDALTIDNKDTIMTNLKVERNYIYSIRILLGVGVSYENYRFQLQIEEGATATEYEPYTGETKHIYLDEPLRKVGDYADYIDFKNQKVIRFVKEKTFDGTENFSGKYIATNNRITHPLPHLDKSVAMLTRSEWKSSATIWANAANLAFDVSYYGVTTVNEFKTKLAGWYEDGKPLKMYYTLGTQTEESIIMPELITPNSTVLNEFINTDLLPSKINLTYYQDIDIKLSDLENNYATKEYVDNAIVLPTAKTAIVDPITVNTIYDLGVQTSIDITLPSGKIGDFIQFDFVSGSTVTTLSVTSTNGLIGYDLIPEVNKIYSLYFDWGVAGYDGTTVSYGWRFNYSEYALNSI